MRIRTPISSKYINDDDVQMAMITNALSHPLRVALIKHIREIVANLN